MMSLQAQNKVVGGGTIHQILGTGAMTDNENVIEFTGTIAETKIGIGALTGIEITAETEITVGTGTMDKIETMVETGTTDEIGGETETGTGTTTGIAVKTAEVTLAA